MTSCPCGSPRSFDACCGAILGGTPAPTAEALMRSRYTAYVRGDIDHIERTNAAALRDVFDRAHAKAMIEETEWTGLSVVKVTAGGPDDDDGQVEFRARFNRLGQELEHHEEAVFHRENGRWVYAEARMNPKQAPRRVERIGRNEPCPCGSGKKYKKCCGG